MGKERGIDVPDVRCTKEQSKRKCDERHNQFCQCKVQKDESANLEMIRTRIMARKINNYMPTGNVEIFKYLNIQ